jgi:hypothetical protein
VFVETIILKDSQDSDERHRDSVGLWDSSVFQPGQINLSGYMSCVCVEHVGRQEFSFLFHPCCFFDYVSKTRITSSKD